MRVIMQRADGARYEVEVPESGYHRDDDDRALRMLANLAPDAFTLLERCRLGTIDTREPAGSVPPATCGAI